MRNQIGMCLIAVLWVVMPMVACAQGAQVSPTKYNYAPAANAIVKGASTKLEKAYKIYLWICDNIQYDTNYRIHTADECFDKRKGVCQAYSELYYRLCEAVGVKCFLVTGSSKDTFGNVRRSDHSWICAEIEGGRILIDPTWGAGALNGNVFTKSEDPAPWFKVNPYWMVFTHLPDDSQFQLMDQAIDYNRFVTLPPLMPELQYLGWNPRELLGQYLRGEIKSMPEILSINGNPGIRLLKLPMQEQLNPAKIYRFEIDNPQHKKVAILTDNDIYNIDQWQRSGTKYWIDLMPGNTRGLHLSMQNEQDYSTYNSMLIYKVSPPTASEAQYINDHLPPERYKLYDESVQFKQIPKYGKLKKGTAYQFIIENPKHFALAIRVNDTWYRTTEWTKSGNLYHITITPQQTGELVVMMGTTEGSYHYMLKYTIVD